ncbi:FERM and PDZ domain-containing protein 2 [Entelurus aequoreus]|uniref:FERM and PDZ domain-containing protein 2 n=1 Tax=Entelurus aequoreus TaxID=161455 RepID=UPI002B1E253B|nr:FERM and PDZ domain-containing protein 2 [Entelurus aequoreus]
MHGGSQLLHAVDGVCAHHSKKIEQDAVGQLTAGDSLRRRFRHQRSATQLGRKCLSHRALKAGCGLHGDTGHGSKTPSSLHCEKTPQESFSSQVPLKLQIKVSGQRDSLGISIAGGKGSLPYKDHDEGVFISRVTKGGPSEKAGVHVGDRLLEVNSFSMQGVTHLEAVRALRNAGSCIRLKVLREASHPRQVGQSDDDTRDAEDVSSRRTCSRDGAKGQQKMEDGDDGLSKKMEAVVCNGNGISNLKNDLRWSQLETEALMKRNDSAHVDKHTMTIPRIILTHPSTSDEDVELLTQGPGRNPPHHHVDIPEKRVSSECFDNAFYPP